MGKYISKKIIGFLLVMIFMLSATFVYADNNEIRVTNEVELQSAVNSSNDVTINVDGTINISTGITIPAGKTFTLTGGTLLRDDNYGGQLIKISDGSSRQTSSIVLTNIIIDGGAEWDRSNIYRAENNGLTARESLIYLGENRALTISDGTVLQNNDIITIANPNKNNFGEPGAIALTDSSKLEISGGEIKDNSALNGGAISLVYTDDEDDNKNYTNILIAGGEITNNRATKNIGGGIAILDGKLVTTGGKISENYIGGIEDLDGNTVPEGGGIYSRSGIVEITGGEVSENICTNGRGGGIATSIGEINITGGKIEGNIADYGGGIYVGNEKDPTGGLTLNGKLSIKNSLLQENESYKHGGGIFILSDAEITIENTTINKNETYGNGGGVYLTPNSNLSIKESTFRDNKGQYGGGLDIEFESTVFVENSTFRGNTAYVGGAINVLPEDKSELIDDEDSKYYENLIVNGTTFENNFATKGGYKFDDSNVNIAKVYASNIADVVSLSTPFGLNSDKAYNNYDISYIGKETIKEERYTVDYYKDNEDEILLGVSPVDENSPYVKDTLVTVLENKTLTKEGYKFVGWSTEPNGKEIQYSVGDTFNIIEDTVLHPVWEIKTYTVSFDSNGGDNIDSKTIKYNELVDRPSDPVKAGAKFLGWFKDSRLSNEWNFATDTVKDNATLYAKWGEFKVTYDENGNTSGTVPIDSNEFYAKDDEVTVLPKGDLSKTGYTFKGWNTKTDGSGTSYKVGDKFKITANTTLYAIWQKDSEDSGTGWTWSGGSSTTSKESPKTEVEETLTHMAYLNGYPDNTIRPQGSITRAEVATIFARLKVGEANIPSATTKYNDVNASDWYSKYIAFVTDNKIMEGYEDGSFKPNDKITRAEFTAVVARYNSLVNVESSFEDVSGHWAAGYIGSVTNKGWINGYPDGTFKPEKDISREEVATMVNKMLDRKVDKDGLNNLSIKNFKDLDNSSWSYFDIVEASNSHKSVRRTLGDIMENWRELL